MAIRAFSRLDIVPLVIRANHFLLPNPELTDGSVVLRQKEKKRKGKTDGLVNVAIDRLASQQANG